MAEKTKTALKIPNLPERASGFTLIEVTFALLVLALGLISTLGLQAASVRRALHDRNMQQAMLAARTILSHIETDEDPIQVTNLDTSLKELTEKYVTDEDSDKSEADIPDMDAHFKVEDWPVPGLISEKPMKRISLTINWSSDSSDQLQVVYFVPSDPNEGATIDPNEEDA